MMNQMLHRGFRAAMPVALAMALSTALADVTRTVSFTYDANGQLATQVVEPAGDPNSKKLTTVYTRDAATGFVTKRQLQYHDPQKNLDVTLDVETIVPDATYRFPATVTNAKGQSEQRVYDPGTGHLLSSTDANGLTTSWGYDGWGRQRLEQRADGTSTTWAYRGCVDSCLDQAVSVVVRQEWMGSSQIRVPQETFADALGRTVLQRSWGFDGSVVLTEHQYDASGRLAQVSRPYFSGAQPVWTVYGYDALGRVTQQQTPSASGSGVDLRTISYNGLATTTLNENHQSRTESLNGLGKLKWSSDNAGFKTSYVYDPFGNLVTTTDARGNQIVVGYDTLGRKTSLVDPELGRWTYSVNPLGQTYSQSDAKNQTTSFTFDELGRMTRRLQPDQDSRWDYDSAAHGVGRLAEAYTVRGDGSRDYRRIYTYDGQGRPSSTTIRLDADYVEEYAYDGFGRPASTTYRRNAAGGSGGPYNTLSVGYNAQGYRNQLTRSDGSTSEVLWTAQAEDALDRPLQEQLGGVAVRRTGFNAYTGRLQSLAVGLDASSATLQNDGYSFDPLGNLASRTQLSGVGSNVVGETFSYDNLNRLSTSTVSGQATKHFGYDALGNLSNRDGVGNYTYGAAGGAGPHAVSGITGTVAGVTNPGFSYDGNGNLLSGLNRSYGWSSGNQVLTVDLLNAGAAVQRTSFTLGPEQQRTSQQVSSVSGGVVQAASRTVYYAGALEKEIDVASNTTTIRTYLPQGLGYVEEKIAGTSVAATASGTRNLRLFLADHLGSPIAVIDRTGTLLQRLAYDPWGRRRNADGTDEGSGTLGNLANAQDHTGYTGQEQLDQLALVHLNGRIYDPLIGRMVSADPTIPDPNDGQSLNRYSYVMNNPLAFTDPSGFEPNGCRDEKSCDVARYNKIRDDAVSGVARNYLWSLVLRGQPRGVYALTKSDGEVVTVDTRGTFDGSVFSTRTLAAESMQVLSDMVGYVNNFALWTPLMHGLSNIVADDLHTGSNVIAGRATTAEKIFAAMMLVPIGSELAPAAKGAADGEKLLFRRGPMDTKKLLESQAQAAENALGIHGVSVSTSPAAKAGQVVRCATCSSVEAAGFKVQQTGKDLNHHTVELPKPITSDVVRIWNELFK